MKKIDKRLCIIVIILVIAILLLVISIKIINKKTEEEQNTEQEAESGSSLVNLENDENVEVTDGVKGNNSEALLKEHTFEGMTIKDISLTSKDGVSTFKCTVENITDVNFEGREIKIIFIDKENEEFRQLEGYLDSIPSGEEGAINASITADISNAYDFYIQ